MQSDNEKFKIEFENRLIQFSISIITLCKEVRSDRNLWPIADQIIRSATSIGANITEAKASSSKRDYLKYFEIALKSANETIYWLIVIEKVLKSNKIKVSQLISEVREISKIIAAAVLTMKGKR